jgi:hypothetical protein
MHYFKREKATVPARAQDEGAFESLTAKKKLSKRVSVAKCYMLILSLGSICSRVD